jgi:ABC-2 type transport system ATP-binding protein
MKRRLDIAMGVINEPRVLFLDEPTAGLDPEVRAELREQIRELAWDRGLTILFTTRYVEEADQLAQRLAIVDQGRIVIQGTPDELKAELRGDGALDAAGVRVAAVTVAQSISVLAPWPGHLATALRAGLCGSYQRSI